MNAAADPNAEDRKGCSGHVGKMVFSASVEQLAIVGYVPDDKSATVGVQAWVEHVLGVVGGECMRSDAKRADSPNGGLVVEAAVRADPEKGKFALKDKDAAMAAAFAYLRQRGAFPEDTGDDDDDECCYGDDAFDNIDDL